LVAVAAPATLVESLKVAAADEDRLATVNDEIMALVEAGAVYRSDSVVAAGADCPSILYVVGIFYAPINRKG